MDRLQETHAAVHLSKQFLVRDAMAGRGGGGGGGGGGGLDSPPRGGSAGGAGGFGGFAAVAGMGVDYDDAE